MRYFINYLKNVVRPAILISAGPIILMFIFWVVIPAAIFGGFGEFKEELICMGISAGVAFLIIAGLFSLVRENKTKFDVPIGVAMLSLVFAGTIIGLPIGIRFSLESAIIATLGITILISSFPFTFSYFRRLRNK